MFGWSTPGPVLADSKTLNIGIDNSPELLDRGIGHSFVMDDGKVIDQGNHEELIKSSEIYKNFYNRQIKNN